MPQSHYSHSEEYQTESSRGSDLSDIMEEDEEELYSEMQLEEGRRRNSHNALKVMSNILCMIHVMKSDHNVDEVRSAMNTKKIIKAIFSRIWQHFIIQSDL